MVISGKGHQAAMASAGQAPQPEQGPSIRPRLVAADVTVRFGPVVALDGFSVNIPQGVIGLLGPNGAGKSTLIKASLGLVPLDAGSIWVGGLDSMAQSLSIRDDIGYMPEHDCLIPNVSAVELVSYLGRMSGMGFRDAMQRGHEVLDFVGIGEERYRLIKSYSTGMKQKVKLAQAIVHDPDLLFLDEPTSGMDPGGREEMLDLVRKIGAADKTIILSSHILQEVERVCEHAVIIREGRLVRDGRIDALMAGEEGLYDVTVRGTPQAIDRFVESLSKVCMVLHRSEAGGRQATVRIRDCQDSRAVFSTAKRLGVQLRGFVPDRLSLEDVFIKAFEGGGKDGD